MKKLKSIVTLVAMMLATSLFAQPPGGGQQGPPPIPNAKEITKMVTEMSAEINLDEAQKESVQEIYTAHFEIVSEKVEAGRPERKEMEALDTKLQEDVEAILDEDQQKLYKAYLKAQKKDRPSR